VTSRLPWARRQAQGSLIPLQVDAGRRGHCAAAATCLLPLALVLASNRLVGCTARALPSAMPPSASSPVSSEASFSTVSAGSSQTRGKAAGCARPDVAKNLRAARVVCFDVDSTLLTVEGIDELADLAGVKDQVQALTTAAMEGGLSFNRALEQRLRLINPSRDLLSRVLTERPCTKHLAANARQLIGLLHQRDVSVYLISGGFKEMIAPVADDLSIRQDNVYANSLRFDEAGRYQSFDPQAWTATAGGKKRAVEHIRQLHMAPGSKDGSELNIVMIGDGATDLEARREEGGGGGGGADVFVCYGGVTERPAVRDAADMFITDFQQLVDLLQADGAS
jgi:phosphoserine phosphatase